MKLFLLNLAVLYVSIKSRVVMTSWHGDALLSVGQLDCDVPSFPQDFGQPSDACPKPASPLCPTCPREC